MTGPNLNVTMMQELARALPVKRQVSRSVRIATTIEFDIAEILIGLGIPNNASVLAVTPGSPGSFSSEHNLCRSTRIVATWTNTEPMTEDQE